MSCVPFLSLSPADEATQATRRKSVGTQVADDHRPSLSCCCQRDAENHPRMGHEANQRKFSENSTRHGSIGVDLEHFTIASVVPLENFTKT